MVYYDTPELKMTGGVEKHMDLLLLEVCKIIQGEMNKKKNRLVLLQIQISMLG